MKISKLLFSVFNFGRENNPFVLSDSKNHIVHLVTNIVYLFAMKYIYLCTMLYININIYVL